MIHTFAAIDVGSFELELGIYEISPKFGIRQLDHVRHVIALGKDTYNDGKISYEMAEETCQVLSGFSDIMKSYKVSACRAYATSAMREAKNSPIVLDQIKVRTGIDVKIISNSEQRFISYKAIAAKNTEFQKTIQKGTAIADVGFGSMQMSLFDKDALVFTQNLPLGVLRMRETLAAMRMTNSKQQPLMEEIIDNELFTFRKMYLKDREIKHLIALGDMGLMLFYKMPRLNPAEKQNHIAATEFNRYFEKLRMMPESQIEENFGLNAEHASLLFPAALIYKRVLDLTGAELVWVPGIRIVDGIAAEYAEDLRLLKFEHNFDNDIIVASRNMAKRYKCHMQHTQAVEQAALAIFDSMKKQHGMKARERLLLQIAANLHACGKFISMRNTSECAYNIIMATEMIGLSHLEREIVANVVRYHIQDFRYNDVVIWSQPHKNSELETRNDITVLIAKLTAILRLANSMDRGHTQKLKGCRVAVKGNELVITTDYAGDVALEQMSIRQKVDFFEEIYGLRPVLKVKRGR